MPRAENVPEISVQELDEMRKEEVPHLLLDVREPSEHAASRIAGAKLMPLGELPGRFGELPRDIPIVVHCHHGGRSAQAVRFLRQAGFEHAKNLTGGIDDWSLKVDPSVPRY